MREAVPEGEGALERGSAEVEVAVSGAQVFASVADLLYGEGRGH